MVNALSCRYVLLNIISTTLIGYEYVKVLYANDFDFSKIYNGYQHLTFGKFYFINGYLFKENQLCVPTSCLRELLLHEAYEGGLIGHFRVAKTLDVLYEHFYWSRMQRDAR